MRESVFASWRDVACALAGNDVVYAYEIEQEGAAVSSTRVDEGAALRREVSRSRCAFVARMVGESSPTRRRETGGGFAGA